MAHPGYIAEFEPNNREQVLSWLMTFCMGDEWQMSPNNSSCIQYTGSGAKRYRWRMSLCHDNRVMFADLEDVQLFVLAWPSKVIDLSTVNK